MGKKADQEKQASPPKSSNSFNMKHSFILLGVAYAVGTLLQHIIANPETPKQSLARGIMVALAGFIAVILAGFKRPLHRWLSSNQLAVPALALLALFSALGTLILQNPPAHILKGAYSSLLPLIQGLFLTDIFHSYGFLLVVGVTAGGLALTTTRKKRYNMRYTGSILAHVGILLILVGMAVGNIWGIKGFLPAHVGNTYTRFMAHGIESEPVPHELGFGLKLEDFSLEHYEADYKLMVYQINDKREKRLLAKHPNPKHNKLFRKYGFELIDYWPDHYLQQIIEPASQDGNSLASLPPALLQLAELDNKKDLLFIADAASNQQCQDTGSGNTICFVWDEQASDKFLTQLKSPEAAKAKHLLIMGKKTIPIAEGQTYSIPNSTNSVKINKLFSDFVMDSKTKKPKNRSLEPNNPAVEISIISPKGTTIKTSWLFAKFPNFKHADAPLGIPNMTYYYMEKPAVPKANALLVGESKTIYALDNNEIIASIDFNTHAPIHLPFGRFQLKQLHQHASISRVDNSKSSKPNNPIAKLKLLNTEQTLRIRPRHPIRLPNGRVLVMNPKGGDTISDYLSQLAIIDNNRKVLSKTIQVNDPLSYNGYMFYQSDYRREDPSFSGLQVVRDPGLWLVYLGLIINTLGIIFAILLPPLLQRTRRSASV